MANPSPLKSTGLTDIRFDDGSFKDPDGRVFYHDGRVFRTLSAAAAERFEALFDGGHLERLVDRQLVIPSWFVNSADIGLDPVAIGAKVIEHRRIDVTTYPFEWSFDMLRDAALVTLDIIERALAFNFILKDATPYNIGFIEAKPVLIDLLSLERYEAGAPWEGYAQFCREFVFPLFLAAYRGIDFRVFFRGQLNGIELATASKLFSVRDLFRPGVWKHVKLQALLERSFRNSAVDVDESYRVGHFSKDAILANTRNLRRAIERLPRPGADSQWIDYGATHTYTADEQAAKVAFVEAMLERLRPRRVVDLGCNTGAYSVLAAASAELVIALDLDSACVNDLYLAVRRKGIRNIVPLVGDLLNPSPAMGWMLRERKSLFERIECDAFLALALVHHICIGGNVPVESFVGALGDIAPGGVVEWVDKSDPMVQFMLRNRADVFDGYTWQAFHAALGARFDIIDIVEQKGGGRRLCMVAARNS